MLNIESLLLQREEMRSSMAMSARHLSAFDFDSTSRLLESDFERHSTEKEVFLRFQLNQNPWLVLKALVRSSSSWLLRCVATPSWRMPCNSWRSWAT